MAQQTEADVRMLKSSDLTQDLSHMQCTVVLLFVIVTSPAPLIISGLFQKLYYY